MTATSIKSRSTNFQQETTKVLTRLRTAFRRVTVTFGTEGTLKSRDLQRQLGLDTRLSWQVGFIVNAEDPFHVGPHVPSPALVKKLIAAARKHGINETALNELKEAYEAFENHIAEYAEDRTSFDSLVAGIIGGDVESQLELNQRRAVFDGLRYIWGIELDLFLGARILYPSLTTPNAVDCAILRVKSNIRRLHARSSILVDVKKFIPGGGPQTYTDKQSVLDADAYARYGMSILPAFCSRSELPLRQTDLQGGGTAIEWISDEIGKPSCVDLVFGDIDRSIPLDKLPEGGVGFGSYATTGTPTRIAVHDLWVHRSTFGNARTQVNRLGHAGYPLLDHRTPSDSLPLPELHCNDRVMFLGSGDAAAHLPEYERYEELLHYTCKSTGWNFEDLDLYRLRMEYPILDTMTAIQFSFPDAVHMTD